MNQPDVVIVRVALPHHLRALASVQREVEVGLEGPATIEAVLDALEQNYPVLKGTIRDHQTRQRRPFIRFFACGQDLSLDPLETPLPQDVINGKELFRVIGAMAGG